MSNYDFVKKANGRILIGGLGIGLLLDNIWDKINTDEIKEILIIENSSSVIDLVAQFYKHDKIRIICADMLEFKPLKGEKFDTIYFDIWPDITTDNLAQIKILHNRFKYFLNKDNPRSWMNSWMKEYLQSQKKKESRYSYY